MLLESLHAILGGESLVLGDVGASFFLPDTWMQLMPLPSARFVLFDPVGKNLSYAKQLPPDRVTVIPTALSREGGLCEFFLANTESGSSLLPPHQWPHRPALSHDYFFPMRVLDIETKTLASSLDEHAVDAVHALKLDTQGSELDIVRGLDARRRDRLLLVEMEVSMCSQPTYIGAPKLSDVIPFFESHGFRHVNTRVERRSVEPLGCTGPKWRSTIPSQHECDAVFVRDVFLDAQRDPGAFVSNVRRLVTLLCAYYMHGEAIETLRAAAAVVSPRERDLFAALEQAVAACAEHQSANLAAGAFTTWHSKVA